MKHPLIYMKLNRSNLAIHVLLGNPSIWMKSTRNPPHHTAHFAKTPSNLDNIKPISKSKFRTFPVPSLLYLCSLHPQHHLCFPIHDCFPLQSASEVPIPPKLESNGAKHGGLDRARQDGPCRTHKPQHGGGSHDPKRHGSRDRDP